MEVIAADNGKSVFEERFDPTRKYALTGKKKYPWFYIQIEDNDLLNRYIKGIEWSDDHCFLDVYYNNDGLVTLHLRIFYIQFLVPLVENVFLDPESKFTGPKEKVITV